MNEKVDVVLIHLNFNSLVRYGNLFHDALMSLIQSVNYALHEGFRCAVVFADNASSDETISTIKSLVEKHAHFSWNILKLDKNYGFARGNNKAYKFAKKHYTFRYVAFVNPDVVFTAEWLTNILRFIDNNAKRENLGLIQPLTLPLSYRKIVDYKAFGNKFSYVSILTGHVIFTDSQLFDSVGGWDETFFLYGEDVDLSLKVLSKKRRNVIYYGSVVFHEAHLSTLGVAVLPDIVSRTILLFRYAHTKGSLVKSLLLSSIYDFLRMSYRLYSRDNNTVYSTLYAWKILLRYLHIIYYQRKKYSSVNAQLIRLNKLGEVERYFLINIIENIRRKLKTT